MLGGVRPSSGPPVRHNVDVVVANRAEGNRWLRGTPDTYRVRVGAPGRPAPDRPQVWGTAHLRPGLEPQVVATRVLDPEDQPHPGSAFHRIRQAGTLYELVPQPSSPSPSPDPIEGEGSVVILAAVPLHDVGGGSRGAQIAQEAAAHGYHVAYVYRYDASESVDLGLRYIHPRLEEYRYDCFDPSEFLARVGIEPRVALVEFPHHDHLPALEALERAGYRLVYDLIDDWADPALGGWWYRPDVEGQIINRSDALIASTSSLVARLHGQTGRAVAEVPNAVNTRIFDHTRSWPAPADLPAGDGPLFEYHGSLYGNWLDWSAVASVADSFPEARIVMIGDEHPHPPLPGNVRFLGLKAQVDLPAYVARADIGLIPFIVSDTTHAVSPLKVFEYMAMGKPVAATPIQPLLGLDGVYTGRDLVATVRRALAGPPPDPSKAADAHGWGERMARILAVLDMELAPARDPAVVIETRPVRHYPPAQRWLP